MKGNKRLTKAFIVVMILAAIAGGVYTGLPSHTLHCYQALTVAALAAATSRMKVKLPGIDGSMSVNMPFLLIAVVNLSAVEALAIACISALVQCWPKRDGELKPLQMLFNVSTMASATNMASLLWHANWLARSTWASESLMLASATATFFLGQTVPVAGIIKLTEGAALRRIWMSLAQLSFPYYVVSAGITSMVQSVSQHLGWGIALGLFPLMYAIHRSYRLYFATSTATAEEILRARTAAAGE